MAGGSSSNDVTITVILQPVAEKLTSNNHSTWRAQVLTTLCGTRLDRFIIDKKKAPTSEVEVKEGNDKIIIPNPEYEEWHATDHPRQSEESTDTLVRTATTKSATEAWKISFPPRQGLAR
jgi:UTP:GlnB (protein PII) uridylyltransferase